MSPPELTLVGAESEELPGSVIAVGSILLEGAESEEMPGSVVVEDIVVYLTGAESEELPGSVNASVEMLLEGAESEELPGIMIVQPPGGVAPEHMDPQDATGLDMWLLDESIETQKIAQVVADKIVGGTISTTDIFIASLLSLASGGELRAGAGTIISEEGLRLLEAATFDGAPLAASYKVSGFNEFAAIWFFSQVTASTGSGQYRGIVLRSDGTASGPSGPLPGEIFICATEWGARVLNTSAVVEVLAGILDVYTSAVYVRDMLIPQSRMRGTYSAGVTVANGVTQNFAHPLGIVPYNVLVQISPDGGTTWRPVTHSATWPIAISATQVSVTNSSGASFQVRCNIIG